MVMNGDTSSDVGAVRIQPLRRFPLVVEPGNGKSPLLIIPLLNTTIQWSQLCGNSLLNHGFWRGV